MQTEPASVQRLVAIKDNRVESGQLLSEKGALLIRHQGEDYQLRRTRSGKLILTK